MELIRSYASDIARITRVVGGNSCGARVWFWVCLWYFAVTRKVLKGRLPDYPLTIVFQGKQIVYHLRYSMDIAVLREVYAEKEYEWCPIENPKVIVDLGAHFGDTTLYYHARFPSATIIAVEPSQESFGRLQQHVAHIPTIVAVQVAVGDTDGSAMLTAGGSALGHSLVERKDFGQTVEVRQVTLATLLREQGITRADLIKFDIEGGEYTMFAGVKPEAYADVYSGEVHTDLAPVDSPDFATYFSEFSVERDELPRGRYVIRAQLTK